MITWASIALLKISWNDLSIKTDSLKLLLKKLFSRIFYYLFFYTSIPNWFLFDLVKIIFAGSKEGFLAIFDQLERLLQDCIELLRIF